MGANDCMFCENWDGRKENLTIHYAQHAADFRAQRDAAVEIAEEYRANPVGPTRRTEEDKVDWRKAILKEAERRAAAKGGGA